MTRDIQKKYTFLRNVISEMGSAVVAYSGGADSALLLWVANRVLGKNCYGVIGNSESLARRELNFATELAKSIGAQLTILSTNEFANELYLQNDERRCYYCKFELFNKIKSFAEMHEIKYILDGSNVDDIADYRPGRQAGSELQVRSPFIESGMNKNDIRILSKLFGLPTWDKPAQPCLASRLAYGQRVDAKVIKKIEQAENYLLSLGFRIVRVRYMGEGVFIEVGEEEVARFRSNILKQNVLTTLQHIGLKNIEIDTEGYKSGNLNKFIKSA